MTPCTNITIQDLLKSSGGISLESSSRNWKRGLSVRDILPLAQDNLVCGSNTNESNCEQSNADVRANDSGFDSTKAATGCGGRRPPKTAAERVRDYRARQKLKRDPKPKTKIPKTGAERARSYRERKKLLALAAKQSPDDVAGEVTSQTSSDATDVQNDIRPLQQTASADVELVGSEGGERVCPPKTKKPRRVKRTPAKSDAQRAREYRARLKLLKERLNWLSAFSSDSGSAEEVLRPVYVPVHGNRSDAVGTSQQSGSVGTRRGKVKKKPKTCAQRAREYRARKKQSLADLRSNFIISSMEADGYTERGIFASVFDLSSRSVGGCARKESCSSREMERARAYRARLIQGAVGPFAALPASDTVCVGDNQCARSYECDPLKRLNIQLVNGKFFKEGDTKGDSVLEPLINIKEEILEEELEPLQSVTVPPLKEELFEEECEEYDEDPLN